DCGGTGICEHGRERNKCKDCGGTGICERGRERSACKDCGGTSICKHGREHKDCKDCGEISICEHSVQKNGCAVCSPYKCQGCGLFVVTWKEEGKRLCSGCNSTSGRRSLWDQNIRRPILQGYTHHSGVVATHGSHMRWCWETSWRWWRRTRTVMQSMNSPVSGRRRCSMVNQP
ncbi:hypothetical protein BDZ88DRAFT_424680, partial [Geranomyces variabilis]